MENDNKKISQPCAVCGEATHSFYAKKNNCIVYRCDICRTLSMFPVPSVAAIEAVYGQEYFSGAGKGFGYVDYDVDKQAMTGTFERHLIRFEKMRGAAGRLLDIGAATGFFMRIEANRGWETSGVEISAYAAELGRSRGLHIETGSLSATSFSAQSFDLITMWDVIEHFPDPISDIKKAASLLKPGGLLAINTPDSGSLFAKIMGGHWHLLVPPEHIHYFNRPSLQGLLKKNGFDVVETGCVGKRFTLEYIVHTLYRWQKFYGWAMVLSYLTKHPTIARLAIRLYLRVNMFILARKK